MDEKKAIYVKRGQKLSVECLQDGVTGQGFFILRDDEGNAVKAREFVTAEGVTFTADESKRTFSKDDLEYFVYLSLKQHLLDDSKWGIDRGLRKDLGEVQYMLAKNIAKVVSDDHDIRLGIGANTIGKICRSLGMRYFRTAQGYAVVLEEEDLKAAEAKFDLPEVEQETRTVYCFGDGIWREEQEASQAMRQGIEGPMKTREIPRKALLPN